jgi:acyl transferase domain-containing protein
MSRPPPAPPRFVPTLTEVVKPIAAPMPAPGQAVMPASPVSIAPPAALAALAASPDLQEQMVQRVLQRVDLVLDRRLREVVGQLILEQTQSLAPRLREEIEDVVRQSVSQAFDDKNMPPATGV